MAAYSRHKMVGLAYVSKNLRLRSKSGTLQAKAFERNALP